MESSAPRLLRAVGAANTGIRWLVAATLVAAAIYTVFQEAVFRRWEAALGARATELVLGRDTRLSGFEPVFAFERVPGDDATWYALVVTHQCTALFFLVPIALIGAFAFASGRSSIPRLAIGLLAVCVFLEVVNLLRILLLVVAVLHWGASAFSWVHDTLGSVLMLGAFTVALVAFFRLGFFGRRDRERRGARREPPSMAETGGV
ncbi:archaeosortase/exosortase family protein [Cellulosimicrobium funkei]|uniref:archaeosortase/exosortase family protein n=1 Tax=Cellulosimicrobium funkei TaxID=264251 RepID=UPI0036A836E8